MQLTHTQQPAVYDIDEAVVRSNKQWEHRAGSE